MKHIPRMTIVYFLLTAVIIVQAHSAAGETVSFEKLIREMADMKSLAEYPDPPFLAARSSSYDRSVTPDSVPSKFANNDHGYFLDTLPEGQVMMEADGPGAVTHVWLAQPGDSLAFYLDSSTTPAWKISVNANAEGGGVIGSPYAAVTSKGRNLYFPVPYQKHCRVVYRGPSPDIYYQIDYRTYAAGTQVATFSPEMIATYKNLLDSIKVVLTDSTGTIPVNQGTLNDFPVTLEPGATAPVAVLNGPGAITEMRFSAAGEFTAALIRKCLVEITFDSAAYPQVRVPLGDFFGGIPHQSAYWTFPVRITADRTMISRWVMPYRNTAAIRLVNYSGQTLSCTVSVAAHPYGFTDNTMYFHTRWRQDAKTITAKNLYWIIYMTDPLQDHSMLHITGKGVHVGTVLQIWNRESAWWGEGDDKITIDDLPAPSFLGTGTEDYFGYAYSSTMPFSHAFHAQPHADIGNGGFITNVRFHISDPQPFTASYRFDMEIQTAYRPTEIDFGRAVFFYATGKAVTDHDTLTEDDLYLHIDTTRLSPPVVTVTPRQTEEILRYDPCRGLLVNQTAGSKQQAIVLRIFRPDGRLIASYRPTGAAARINTATLTPGVYIAEVHAAGHQQRIRFMTGR